MTTNIRQGLHNVVSTASSVTSKLANGASSVHLAGRVSPSTPKPCIGIRFVGRSGGSRRLPFFIDTYFIYVYDTAPSAQAVQVINIDSIVGALRQEIHGVSRASLAVDANEERVLECHMEGLDSPDLWDPTLEANYRFIRVRIEGVYLYDYRS
jgi:hypothetical protein